MIMSQRYPTYFDGLVSGAPAMRTGFSNLGMRSVAVALAAAAQRDADGAVIPGSALSDGDKKLIVDSLLATCDAKDGLADGLISDPIGCDFSPSEIACTNDRQEMCLDPKQTVAVAKAMGGARTATGRRVYPGYLYDTGITTTAQGIPGVLNGAPSPVGPRVPPTTQDVDAEVTEVLNAPSTLGDSAGWTNLSTFSGHGGKLLFYHGVSDPWFSALDTVQYYDRLAAGSGGLEATRNWSRLYLVPGMGHCGGGAALDQFDMLSALVDWVERDRAPAGIVATGAAFPGRSRPLCPYPQHAHYDGTGNPDDAASFECR
jgi:feruloyl esterase